MRRTLLTLIAVLFCTQASAGGWPENAPNWVYIGESAHGAGQQFVDTANIDRSLPPLIQVQFLVKLYKADDSYEFDPNDPNIQYDKIAHPNGGPYSIDSLIVRENMNCSTRISAFMTIFHYYQGQTMAQTDYVMEWKPIDRDTAEYDAAEKFC